MMERFIEVVGAVCFIGFMSLTLLAIFINI